MEAGEKRTSKKRTWKPEKRVRTRRETSIWVGGVGIREGADCFCFFFLQTVNKGKVRW